MATKQAKRDELLDRFDAAIVKRQAALLALAEAESELDLARCALQAHEASLPKGKEALRALRALR